MPMFYGFRGVWASGGFRFWILGGLRVLRAGPGYRMRCFAL